ncbi:MAG: acetate kinase [Pseudomonadota bacterium]
MKILVINTGSSSIKYQLFDMDTQAPLSMGFAEKIGETEGFLRHIKFFSNKDKKEHDIHAPIENHQKGLDLILGLLTDHEWGVIQDKSEITAVGHRVVHGGEQFHTPTLINDAVIDAIKKNIPLAPLHNPPNLLGIEVALTHLPEAKQVAVFDTAFHHGLPAKAFMYALPYELYEKEKVRRYGFHGTSHGYVADHAAQMLEKPISSLKIITIHLGNGASMAAVDGGICVDTSMGMTPLEGLIMGTRTGDVDPALPFFLANHLKMTLSQIDTLLNKQSGLKGVCGSNDMREVIEKYKAGDQKAQLAFDMYAYRIKKYIGAYYAILGGLDALVFTAGIGENSSEVRSSCLSGLNHLGIVLDEAKNNERSRQARAIQTSESSVSILVIPTNEELKIARETLMVLEPV